MKNQLLFIIHLCIINCFASIAYSHINHTGLSPTKAINHLSTLPFLADIEPSGSNTLYVNQAVTGGDQSGKSWENAIPELADALLYARQRDNYTSGNPLKIFVAVGTYIPKYHSADSLMSNNGERYSSFVMVKNVQIYGGFDPANGIRELTDQRILPTQQQLGTVLTGEIGIPDYTDNIHTIVMSCGDVESALLDGFTITRGYSIEGITDNSSYKVNKQLVEANIGGSGVFVEFSSPIFRHLVVTDNYTNVGGIYVKSAPSPVFQNIIVTHNTAGTFGGGIYCTTISGVLSSPTFTDLLISDNLSALGGGITLQYITATIERAVITNNTAVLMGGGVAFDASHSTLTNVLISNNLTSFSGGGVLNVNSRPTITNVTVTNNNASEGSEWWHNDTVDEEDWSTIRNSIIWGNGVYGTFHNSTYSLIQDQSNANYTNPANYNLPTETDPQFDEDYAPILCSPAINAGTIDLTGLNLPAIDLAGQPRIFAGRIDLGAFENQEFLSASSVVNSPGSWEFIQTANGTTHYVTKCNEWIASITTTGQPADIAGPTTVSVWLDDSQPMQYVRRHYEITPSTNASTATGRVTLYFTQEEFDDFNALEPELLLPSGPDGDKSTIKIEKRAGSSSDGLGTPNSYTGEPVTITDVEVSWNADYQRWEVSFMADGFSGFWLKTTPSPLPVRWISFEGKLNDQHQALLSWHVEEKNVANYQVQRRTDKGDFTTIATLPSQGEGLQRYTFTDPQLVAATAYYRIRQIDFDGSTSYSRMVAVSSDRTIQFRLYPNPVGAQATLKVDSSLIGQELTLTNAAGQLLQHIKITHSQQSLRLDNYPAGVYLLYTPDGHLLKVVKK